jgi:nucleoside-diphosphate-sugar epimerase
MLPLGQLREYSRTMTSTPILVTGGTGHLGANLIRRLLRDGHAVRVLVRPGRDNGAFDGLDLEVIEGDLRDREAVENAVRGCRQIYHCAAHVSTIEGDAAHKREIFESNVLGTMNLLDAAKALGVQKVVVSGSLSATGYEKGVPSVESDPFYPFDRHLPYGFTKHLVEHHCLRAHADGLDVVVAVSCAIIGPNDFVPSRFGQVLIDFAHGKLNAYIPGGFEFVSTEDIVEGHVLAMAKGRSGQKYLISTTYSTVDNLLDIFSSVTGKPKPWLRLPIPVMAAIAGVMDTLWFRFFPNQPRRFTPAAVRLLSMHRKVDNTKARTELGYQPTSLRDAVQSAYDDFVRRGLIRR